MGTPLQDLGDKMKKLKGERHEEILGSRLLATRGELSALFFITLEQEQPALVETAR